MTDYGSRDLGHENARADATQDVSEGSASDKEKMAEERVLSEPSPDMKERVVVNLLRWAGEHGEKVRAVEGVIQGNSFHFGEQDAIPGQGGAQRDIVVKEYRGSAEEATRMFRADVAKMAARGYYPTAQNFCPGTYGVGAFLLATILCFFCVGIIIFLFLLLVKPPGVLTVTYERRAH
jgi:hypothetical protein